MLNIERWLLIVSTVFLTGVIVLFVLHNALRTNEYEVSKMFIECGRVVKGTDPIEPYRLQIKSDPFKEERAAVEVEVTIELPAWKEKDIDCPPVFWNKEGY